MLREIIYAALVSLPPWYQDTDEDPEARAARLSRVAIAIEAATDEATCTGTHASVEGCSPTWPAESRLTLAALLVSQGWWESRYASHVHAGKCRVEQGECDGGRARSPWQVQSSTVVPREEWFQIRDDGQQSTSVAARAAARVLAVGREKCGTLVGAVASYATGKRCTWERAEERLRHARRIEATLASPSE